MNEWIIQSPLLYLFKAYLYQLISGGVKKIRTDNKEHKPKNNPHNIKTKRGSINSSLSDSTTVSKSTVKSGKVL